MQHIVRLPESVSRVRWREDPLTVYVTGEFDEDTATQFAQDLSAANNTGQSVVPVVINSGGGDVYSLMMMVAAIRSSAVPVATIVPGFAASAAAALFACGTKGMRYIAPTARVMLHDASLTMYSTVSLRDMEIEKDELAAVNKQMFDIMGENCHDGDKTYFHKLLKKQGNRDLYLDANAAVKHKLATCAYVPVLRTSVHVTSTLERPERAAAAHRAPRLTAGAYAQPRGRPPKNSVWDARRGCWKRVTPARASATKARDAQASDGSASDSSASDSDEHASDSASSTEFSDESDDEAAACSTSRGGEDDVGHASNAKARPTKRRRRR